MNQSQCCYFHADSTGQAAVKFPKDRADSRFQFSHANCQGMETSLEQCDFGHLGKSDCPDVAILCDFRNSRKKTLKKVLYSFIVFEET